MPNSSSARWLKEHYPSKDGQTFVARAYRTAFSGLHGQAVLLDLQKACYTIDTTTRRQSGPIDPYQMAINEGRRQAYLHIAGILEIAGVDLAPQGDADYDHRDERRGGDDGEREYRPRYPGGHSTELDGPIPAGEPGSAE